MDEGEAANNLFAAVSQRNTTSVSEYVSPSLLEIRNESGRTPLLQACLLGYEEIVSQLLEAGASVHAADEDGNTALTLAAGRGDAALISLLLRYGADPHVCNEATGESPVANAAGWGSPESVLVLLGAGARLDQPNHAGVTPLMRACANSNTDTASVLLANGANVNAQDKRGRAALHWAVKAASVEIARLLVAKGASWNVRDNAGMSPRDIVEHEGESAFRRLLRESDD